MGTYSFWEHYETFGGMPEPGEAYTPLEAIDHLRKAYREDALLHDLDGGESRGRDPRSPHRPGHGPHVTGQRESSQSPGGAKGSSSRWVLSGRTACGACGAGPDDDCAPGCEANCG